MVYSSPRIRQRRAALRRRKQRILLSLVVLACTAFLIWGAIGWGRSFLIKKSVKTTVVSTGLLQQTVPVDAIVLTAEELVIANVSGLFHPVAVEGQRIRKGEIIGKLVSSEMAMSRTETVVVAPCTGLVSFQLDGLEGFLTREKWEQLDLGQLVESKGKHSVQQGNWIEAGKPLARIVDNLANTNLGLELLVQDLPLELKDDQIKAGDTLRLKLPDVEENKVKVVSVQRDASRIRIIVELPKFREDMLYHRQVPVELITQCWTGFVLPREVLVFQQEGPGVYILRKGWTRWKSVEVVGELNNEVVLTGLNEGEIVVLNPSLVREGLRLH